ncbi:MAG TPA: hypothetical protein VK203_27555 [Nostocaceae cyanobacterium]|nr:hypothetical protein [Nostocaceae cyanobacterium]
MPKYTDKTTGCRLEQFGTVGTCKRARLTPEQMAQLSSGVSLEQITQVQTFKPGFDEEAIAISWRSTPPPGRKHLLNKFRTQLAQLVQQPCNNNGDDDHCIPRTTSMFTMFTCSRIPNPHPQWCKWEKMAGSRRYCCEIDFTHPGLAKVIPPVEQQPDDKSVIAWLKSLGFHSVSWCPYSFQVKQGSYLEPLNQILPNGITFESCLPSYILPKGTLCFQINRKNLPKKLATTIENFLQGNSKTPSSVWCAWQYEGVLAVPSDQVQPVGILTAA